MKRLKFRIYPTAVQIEQIQLTVIVSILYTTVSFRGCGNGQETKNSLSLDMVIVKLRTFSVFDSMGKEIFLF